MLGVTLLFALPFLGKRNAGIGVRNRPMPLAIGTTVIVAIVYLTCMGFAGAKPYGETIRVPDRPLTTSEQRGLFLYADRRMRLLSSDRRHRRPPCRTGFEQRSGQAS